MTRINGITGPRLYLRLAGDPAPVNALTGAVAAVEALQAGIAWPSICTGETEVAQRVRERMRHRLMMHRSGRLDPEDVLVTALFGEYPRWWGSHGHGREDPWTLASGTGYVAWLNRELRDDPEAFALYSGYVVVTALGRASPPFVQLTFGGLLGAGALGAPVAGAPLPVAIMAGAIGLVQAMIALRQQWAQMRVHEETARTEIMRQTLAQEIYRHAGKRELPEDVLELAVRTALPGAVDLSSPNVAELKLLESPDAHDEPPMS